jgi:hypothetical protein
MDGLKLQRLAFGLFIAWSLRGSRTAQPGQPQATRRKIIWAGASNGICSIKKTVLPALFSLGTENLQ